MKSTIISALVFGLLVSTGAVHAATNYETLKAAATKCETDSQCEKVTARTQKYRATLHKKADAIAKAEAKAAEAAKKREAKKAAIAAELKLLDSASFTEQAGK